MKPAGNTHSTYISSLDQSIYLSHITSSWSILLIHPLCLFFTQSHPLDLISQRLVHEWSHDGMAWLDSASADMFSSARTIASSSASSSSSVFSGSAYNNHIAHSSSNDSSSQAAYSSSGNAYSIRIAHSNSNDSSGRYSNPPYTLTHRTPRAVLYKYLPFVVDLT